jgi:hypothetical protein
MKTLLGIFVLIAFTAGCGTQLAKIRNYHETLNKGIGTWTAADFIRTNGKPTSRTDRDKDYVLEWSWDRGTVYTGWVGESVTKKHIERLRVFFDSETNVMVDWRHEP